MGKENSLVNVVARLSPREADERGARSVLNVVNALTGAGVKRYLRPPIVQDVEVCPLNMFDDENGRNMWIHLHPLADLGLDYLAGQVKSPEANLRRFRRQHLTGIVQTQYAKDRGRYRLVLFNGQKPKEDVLTRFGAQLFLMTDITDPYSDNASQFLSRCIHESLVPGARAKAIEYLRNVYPSAQSVSGSIYTRR